MINADLSDYIRWVSIANNTLTNFYKWHEILQREVMSYWVIRYSGLGD